MRRSNRALILPINEELAPRKRTYLRQARRKSIDARARWVIRISLLLIAVLLNGDFHPALSLGGEGSAAQQYVGLLCWLIIIAASFFATPELEMEWSVGLYVNIAFYVTAILSFLWSQNPEASLPKCLALAIVLFGAWRLTLVMDWEEIGRTAHDGLFIVGVSSIFVALAVPSIGVLDNWQHAGQWNGVFISKQTLGVVGAVQLFQASYLLMSRARSPYYWLSAAVAVICVVASGSRGGGALAIAALVSLYIMRLSPGFARMMAYAPFFMGLVAAALIADLLYTQNRYLVIFGVALDFTERTFIWQHALRFIWSRPWLGYGVNGFWTLDWVKSLYLERYSWFLDNYHNGYINILVETGFVGYGLFLFGYLCFGFRANEIARRGFYPERYTSFGLAFTFLLFLIDFTETFFLRSTNFRTTMLTMILAMTFARPVAPAMGAQQRSAAPLAPHSRRLRATKAT
ncbi:O-antigen ligase family protein [Methylocystis sp. JAN1]|uniref:O-antigen ligase family protein n=1 Tax=Methylocystis sp. JAN1 TaxID=3397211 RepID=UPI003FA2D8A0